MTTERDTGTRIVLSWLREDAHENAERVLLRALDEVDATPQRRLLGPVRRSFDMHPGFRIALVAAAALVVVVAGYRLITPAPGPGGRETASPSPISATPVPTTQVWNGRGVLAPGRWAMDIGTVRVTFDILGEWQENVVPDMIWASDSDGRFGFLTVDNLYVDPCDTTAEREPAIGPTVDDLATALATLPGVPVSSPTDVSLGGFSGKLVEFDLPSSTAPCGEDGIALWPFFASDEPTPLEAGARTRIWILDVDGSRFVVVAVERTALTPAIRAQLQGILDSIEIEP